MIPYESGGINFLLNVFQVRGSVFPSALYISIPCGLLTGAMTFFMYDVQVLGSIEIDNLIMKNNAIWGGFSFLVGFLVVFRTSQAYSRFWEGCTATHNMGAEWFDSCSSLIAFTKHTGPEKRAEVLRFQNTLVRLFSMLHATALGDIEDCSGSEAHDVSAYQAFKMELIDPEAIDEESLLAVKLSDSKVELLFQWIQQLIVENINFGVLCIPPPILTRSFQEIANGMVHFHNALKISTVPFPFPYAQTCDCMLLMHWLMVPFIVAQWVEVWWIACIFAFIQVFTLWTLNLIAVELENPFGSDPNDIDSEQMQMTMNTHLRLLIRPSTLRTPILRTDDYDVLSKAVTEPAAHQNGSFFEAWLNINGAQSFQPARRVSVLRKRLKGDKMGSTSSRTNGSPKNLSHSATASSWRRNSSRPFGTPRNSENSNASLSTQQAALLDVPAVPDQVAFGPQARTAAALDAKGSCRSAAAVAPHQVGRAHVPKLSLGDVEVEDEDGRISHPSTPSSSSCSGESLTKTSLARLQAPAEALLPAPATARSNGLMTARGRGRPHMVAGQLGTVRSLAADSARSQFIVCETTPRGAPHLVETVLPSGRRLRSEEPPELVQRFNVSSGPHPDCDFGHIGGDTDSATPEGDDAVYSSRGCRRSG